MNVLDNHELFNKLQVLGGVKAAHENSVSAYILECKLKKIVRKHASISLLGELTELINKKNKGNRTFIKLNDLLYDIQQLHSERLQELIEQYEQEGIMNCLTSIVNTEREITKRKKRHEENTAD